jgi:hypothetical protein
MKKKAYKPNDETWCCLVLVCVLSLAVWKKVKHRNLWNQGEGSRLKCVFCLTFDIFLFQCDVYLKQFDRNGRTNNKQTKSTDQYIPIKKPMKKLNKQKNKVINSICNHQQQQTRKKDKWYTYNIMIKQWTNSWIIRAAAL